MIFEYPLGLIGLIGIPILIIIYIIKNKHTEQIISSTYLWQLSEKFLQKKKPISILSGIISLILQIIAVTSISLLIAHPIITIPNSAKEYCFILDGSGSMNMLSNDSISRIELAKDEINDIIWSSTDGSKYTLVFVSSNPRIIYEKISDKEKAIELLSKLEPEGITENYDTTINYVQEYFNENNSLVTYLVTDKDYNSNNIEIINVSNKEDNYTVVDAKVVSDSAGYSVVGKVLSYESDTKLIVELSVDDEIVDSKEIDVKKLTETEYSFMIDSLDYSSIKISITNVDGLMADNSRIIYNLEKEHAYNALIVSEHPFYLESAINTVGYSAVSVISPSDYSEEIKGYSLYIFDSFKPSKLPTDGTIWLFGIDESLSEAGFSVQDVIEDDNGILVSYPKNSTSLYKTLTSGLLKDKIYVSKYVKYGVYKNFTTLLAHEGNPIIFTGIADNGCREVVFAFDLHDSNLPLLPDYLTLVNNLLNYSFPIILEEAEYICGDTVNINVISNCDSIRVLSPSGNVSYLSVTQETQEFIVTEAGTYKITMMFGEEVKEFNIFVSLPSEESYIIDNVYEIGLQGNIGNDFTDGIYDKLIVLFVLLAIVFVADWVVYCYEQYQLR